MALGKEGILRCAHGMFVPASALRREVGIRVLASLRASLPHGEGAGIRCASCLAPMRIARLALQDRRGIEIAGCERCGGSWLDAGTLARLRTAVLTRRVAKPRDAAAPGVAEGTSFAVADGLFGVLETLGAYTA